VNNTVLISVKTESTHEQMNKSTCNYINSVQLKIHSNTISKSANMHWMGLIVQMVMYNSVHWKLYLAKYTLKKSPN